MSDEFATATGIQSVSEVGAAIQRSIRELGSGVVEAEVRKITVAASGHWYLELADSDSVIGAVVWKGSARAIPSPPKQGDLVQAAFERIDFYPPHGKVQLILSFLAPTGEGVLLARRKETLAKLTAEGLTDPQKRPSLRPVPRKIGLIAGTDSDAAKDVITALRRRFAPIPIVFCPALVQGVQSPGSVTSSIAALNQVPEIDVIILARGGGSVTDLSPFDDEALCRAIFASPVPVITSIGHTKDRPVCDHVSAAQAEVPARAAEFAVAVSREEALAELARAGDRLLIVRQRFDAAKRSVAECGNRISVSTVLSRFSERLANARTVLESSTSRLRTTIADYGKAFDRHSKERSASATRSLKLKRERLDSSANLMGERAHNVFRDRHRQITQQLELLAAADITARGAIFATDQDGRVVRSVDDLTTDQAVDLNFADGQASTTVKTIKQVKENE